METATTTRTKTRQQALRFLKLIKAPKMLRIRVDGTATEGITFLRPLRNLVGACKQAGVELMTVEYSMWSPDGKRWFAMDKPAQAYIVINR